MQSRYYDPIVKRFLNADSYASTGQGFLGFNMFAYCGNNSVNGIDPTGTIDTVCRAHTDGKSDRYYENWLLNLDLTYAKYPIDWYSSVGAGIQFDISAQVGAAGIGCGVEYILFWGTDTAKKNGDCLELAVYFYTIPGSSIDIIECMNNLKPAADIIRNNADRIKEGGKEALESVANDIKVKCGVSASGILVFGNENFRNASDYVGRFDTWSASGVVLKGFYSWSDCCRAYGIGGNIIPSGGWGVSRSVSYYFLLSSNN